MSKESIESLTKDLKQVLIRTKKELQNKDDSLKKHRTVHDLTKKEYQKLYEENSKLKKQLQQYEVYMKTQQIEKEGKKKTNLKDKRKSANVGKSSKKTICLC